VWERVAYNVSTAVNVAYNEPVLAPVADTVAFTPEVLSQTVAGGILKAAGKVLFAAREEFSLGRSSFALASAIKGKQTEQGGLQ
jgi:hypothetical protein